MRTLPQRFVEARTLTVQLAAPLSAEDQTLQSMPDASPTRWHLAHTTWFFATFLLEPYDPGFAWPDPRYRELFNSYYEGVGPQFSRARRGLLSRPGVAEILAWRRAVDEAVVACFGRADPALRALLAPIIELGIQHEQQHQELLLTDIKHALFQNPLQPAYRDDLGDIVPAPTAPSPGDETPSLNLAGGRVTVGAAGGEFHFDNERPEHPHWLHPFRVAAAPVSNGRYREFIEDGGYLRPDLWLSDGWAACREQAWSAPLYWIDGAHAFTLRGVQRLDPQAPVCHLSFFEADAFARWAGARLPTEFEWEHFACLHGHEAAAGTLLDDGALHPLAGEASGLRGLWGGAWEWTASDYAPYPRFRPLPGALGEYNGKFMSGARVLRGGSCVTSHSHLRWTYRNFFAPEKRWQFSGIRLAMDA
jgi:ergothioneine biosynthesis protein EgtB